jgi:peptidoglycan hydrolase CwlO-like protein
MIKKAFFIFVVFSLFSFKVFGESNTLSDERAILEAELKKIEAQLEQLKKEIAKTEKEKQTLKNQIALLEKKITELNLQIKKTDLAIQESLLNISQTEASIQETQLKIDDLKEKLKKIFRKITEQQEKNNVKILLLEKNISTFYDNVFALRLLNSKQKEVLASIKILKEELEKRKEELEKQKLSLEKTLKFQVLQKKENEDLKQEKSTFLKMTEAQYKKYLQEKAEAEKRAAEIRAKLFQLIGIAKYPTFGEAIELAKSIGNMLEIRPAFLLAILSQESAIGRNVGQCYLKDENTGDGVKINSGENVKRVMNPKRDVPIFLELTKKLGRDPKTTPVSCWIPLYSKGKPIGWGGAMGPAQFIPSTWKFFEDRLAQILGKTPDPWEIKDSFLAAALYLKELGADQKTRQAEVLAANKYSGGYSWYAGEVMKRADCIQNFLDQNSMSLECQQLIGLR